MLSIQENVVLVLEQVKYLNWDWIVTDEYMQVIMPNGLHGRKWRLSAHMTESEIVQTALLAILTAQEHEVREFFLYRTNESLVHI